MLEMISMAVEPAVTADARGIRLMEGDVEAKTVMKSVDGVAAEDTPDR
jgi:hypothetical protein